MRILDIGIIVQPSSQEKLLHFWGYLKWAAAGVGAFLLQRPTGPFALFRVYMLFMLYDFVTGVVASCLMGKVSSNIAGKGIAKKVMGIACVGFAQAIDIYLGATVEGGGPGPARGVVVRMLIGMEFFSITENLAAAGIVLPKSVSELFRRLTSPAVIPGTKVVVDVVKETEHTVATTQTLTPVPTVAPAKGEKGDTGDIGPEGPQGPQGPAGSVVTPPPPE